MKYSKETFPKYWWFTIPERGWEETEAYAENFWRGNSWGIYRSSHDKVYIDRTDDKPILRMKNNAAPSCCEEISYEEFLLYVLKKEEYEENYSLY